MNYIFLPLLVLSLLEIVGCETLRGPVGPEGPQGLPGQDATVETVTGTVLNRNYTEGNPHAASIHLESSGNEPTVLFIGIENANGVFVRQEFSAVIWGGVGSEYAVPYTSGWYVLVYDPDKDLLRRNYQVKFIR